MLEKEIEECELS